MNFVYSAQSCRGSQKFTHQLIEAYKKVQNDAKNKFEIVFVSDDQNQPSFNNYYKTMPWKAIPFSGKLL